MFTTLSQIRFMQVVFLLTRETFRGRCVREMDRRVVLGGTTDQKVWVSNPYGRTSAQPLM